MNRLLFLIALVFALHVPLSADACQRCGLFGRGCRYASTYYAPKYYAPAVAYVPPSNVQNFVFNNSYPVAALTAGNSVYGYSLASSAYTVDNGLLFDRAARFTELALQTGQRATDGFNSSLAQSLALTDAVDRRSKNTLLALSAIEANSGSQAASSLSFRATVQNGKLSVQRLEAASQTNLQGIQICAACHDGRGGPGRGPADIVLDGSVALTDRQHERTILSVVSGRMPLDAAGNPVQLSNEQKTAVLADLCKIAPIASQPRNGGGNDLPPPPEGGGLR